MSQRYNVRKRGCDRPKNENSFKKRPKKTKIAHRRSKFEKRKYIQKSLKIDGQKSSSKFSFKSRNRDWDLSFKSKVV